MLEATGVVYRRADLDQLYTKVTIRGSPRGFNESLTMLQGIVYGIVKYQEMYGNVIRSIKYVMTIALGVQEYYDLTIHTQM